MLPLKTISWRNPGKLGSFQIFLFQISELFSLSSCLLVKVWVFSSICSFHHREFFFFFFFKGKMDLSKIWSHICHRHANLTSYLGSLNLKHRQDKLETFSLCFHVKFGENLFWDPGSSALGQTFWVVFWYFLETEIEITEIVWKLFRHFI